MMIRTLAALALVSLGACDSTPPKMSMSLALNGENVAECGSATVSKLGGGGWRFLCPGTDVYVIYDSTVAKDGTIKDLTVTAPDKDGLPNDEQQWAVAVAVTRHPEVDFACPSAKALGRKTGEPPLRTSGNGPAPGTYELALARPCGTATLTLGAAH